MTDRRKTFENASPETSDVVLCLFCGETLHAPEDDVFWEDTAEHECKEMLVGAPDSVARLANENTRLKARVAELERDNAILRAEQSGAVYVCPECDIAGCKHVRAALTNKDASDEN